MCGSLPVIDFCECQFRISAQACFPVTDLQDSTGRVSGCDVVQFYSVTPSLVHPRILTSLVSFWIASIMHAGRRWRPPSPVSSRSGVRVSAHDQRLRGVVAVVVVVHEHSEVSSHFACSHRGSRMRYVCHDVPCTLFQRAKKYASQRLEASLSAAGGLDPFGRIGFASFACFGGKAEPAVLPLRLYDCKLLSSVYVHVGQLLARHAEQLAFTNTDAPRQYFGNQLMSRTPGGSSRAERREAARAIPEAPTGRYRWYVARTIHTRSAEGRWAARGTRHPNTERRNRQCYWSDLHPSASLRKGTCKCGAGAARLSGEGR